MMLLNMLWHEFLHGRAWTELNPASKRTRKYGAVIECECGKRWLSRYPWDRRGL